LKETADRLAVSFCYR